jgi:uncharacterized protein YfaP (DUF2135 family)
MTKPLAGVYVNYWGNFNDQGYAFDEGVRERDVIAGRVNIVFDEKTPAERHETYVVPMRKIGDPVHVPAFQRAG